MALALRACRSCGASIGFIPTPRGAAVPVDAELIRTWVVETAPTPAARRLVLVTEMGTTVSGYEASAITPGAEAVEGHLSHFATCTDPRRWRTRA